MKDSMIKKLKISPSVFKKDKGNIIFGGGVCFFS